MSILDRIKSKPKLVKKCTPCVCCGALSGGTDFPHMCLTCTKKRSYINKIAAYDYISNLKDIAKAHQSEHWHVEPVNNTPPTEEELAASVAWLKENSSDG